MFVVALTGNYGMGKSSVASLFRKCGACTLDSDAIVANLLKTRSVIKEIRKLLGPEVLNADHSLNKSVVADIIFQNNTARKKIETLLHPLVFQEIASEVKKLRLKITPPPPAPPLNLRGGRGSYYIMDKGRFVQCKSCNCLVIVEVPLLFEGKFQKWFDRTIAVYTNQKTALVRLKKKGISRKDALARFYSQIDIREKKRLADYVIDNNGTRQQAMAQVRKVFKALMEDEEQ
jgi:dephospho-CoA kinase